MIVAHRGPWARIRSRGALGFALLALMLSLFIVVPAPTRLLLPLGVGAPELSGVLTLHAILAMLAAMPDVRSSRMSRWALGVGAIALFLAISPLVRFPPVARAADATLQATLGPAYASDFAPPQRSTSGSAPVVTALARTAPLVIADLFRPFAADSARITRDIVFARPSGEALTMDVYRPMIGAAGGAKLPVLVQIYGGAWQRGEPSDFAEFARYFAARGYVVFAIDYRHAPQYRYPAQLEDVRAALAHIASHAEEFNADTSRMVLLGRSAGAHLAMLAAYSPGAPPVRGVISYYGPVDLTEGYRHPPSPDPLRVRDVDAAFLGGSPAQQPNEYREASPITYATRRQPPTLLLYGGRDHIVEARFGRMLRDALRDSGNTVVHVEIPWAEHAFDAVPNGPSGQLARYVTERFLAWAVSPGNQSRMK